MLRRVGGGGDSSSSNGGGGDGGDSAGLSAGDLKGFVSVGGGLTELEWRQMMAKRKTTVARKGIHATAVKSQGTFLDVFLSFCVQILQIRLPFASSFQYSCVRIFSHPQSGPPFSRRLPR